MSRSRVSSASTAATEVLLEKAYGLAHRGYEIPNEVGTRFAIASGLKGMTALAVVSLVEQGALDLATTARSLLGDDLPLIGDDVTVEHLLAHRSGIGDYLDEDLGGDITDYVMPVPVHQLADTEQFLAVLDGYPPKFAAGERFSYCNGGYVVLALIAERAIGMPYHDLVAQRVCEPAGMRDTAFLRSDELPGSAALGYLAATACGRTSSTYLCAVRATAASTRRPPTFVRSGRRSSRADRSPDWVAEMTRPAVIRPSNRGATALASGSTVDRHRDPRGLRRRRLVPVAPRPADRHDVHGHLELDQRSVADRPIPRGAPSDLNRRWVAVLLHRSRLPTHARQARRPTDTSRGIDVCLDDEVCAAPVERGSSPIARDQEDPGLVTETVDLLGLGDVPVLLGVTARQIVRCVESDLSIG